MAEPDNCINIAAVRFGERVTITVVNNQGRKASKTVDTDSVLYSLILEIADNIMFDTPLSV